jgi:hypothetical protein
MRAEFIRSQRTALFALSSIGIQSIGGRRHFAGSSEGVNARVGTLSAM